MATAVKAYRTLVTSGTSNGAGSATTGTVWDVTTAIGGVITALVTNGGTAPTLGCDFVVQVSGDNTNWKEFSRQTAGNAASTSYPFAVDIPLGFKYVRPYFSGNTGQAVTVESFGHEITSIG